LCAHGTSNGPCGIFSYLGYPEQAAHHRHEALMLAQELAHPYTTAGTLCLVAVSALLMGEWQQALEWAEAVAALSREQGFPYSSAWGTIVQGAALSALGRPHQGDLALRQGLDRYRATGAAVLHTYWAVLLAETLGRVGEAGEGIRLIEAALATISGSGERRSEAELYRSMGTLLQASPSGTQAAAESRSGGGA
jgi:predicted ATPase